jgi:proline iminopeptidase
MKPLLVVHGGPGLDHSYLKDVLDPLSSLRDIHYYDQLGCGDLPELSNTFTFDSLVKQFEREYSSLSSLQAPDVLAHSWGALIIYAALSQNIINSAGKIILVSPVGLTIERFEQSGDRLVSRIPSSVMSKIELEPDGVKQMRLLSKYYLSPASQNAVIKFGSYRPLTYDSTVEAISKYDYRGLGSLLSSEIFLMYGEDDIVLPSETAEIHSISTVSVIEKSGHFPFHERPKAALRLTEDWLSNLSK